MQQTPAYIHNYTTGVTHSLQPESSVIGRHPDSEIYSADRFISRHHAVIFKSVDGWIIADLGSKYGTIVNGQVISRPSRVNDGDRVLLGATHFRLCLHETANFSEIPPLDMPGLSQIELEEFPTDPRLKSWNDCSANTIPEEPFRLMSQRLYNLPVQNPAKVVVPCASARAVSLEPAFPTTLHPDELPATLDERKVQPHKASKRTSRIPLFEATLQLHLDTNYKSPNHKLTQSATTVVANDNTSSLTFHINTQYSRSNRNSAQSGKTKTGTPLLWN